MALAPFLLKLSRRAALSSEELSALEGVLEPPRILTAQQDMVVQGDHPTHSTVLLEGLAARYHRFEDGGRQFSQMHLAGDFVDLHSLLLEGMDHSVLALTDCRIALAPHERLRELTNEHPRLARLLWLDTIIDGAIHRQWIARMGRLSSVANFAHLICELFERYKLVDLADDHSFELPLTQGDLADVLGLSNVHVNRIVQELRGSGTISWDGRKVVVLDLRRLVAQAEFDPTYLQLQPRNIG